MRVKIAENKQIATGIYQLVLEYPSNFINIKPGQFIFIREDGQIHPLLPRPFSVAKIINNKVYILYKVRGRVTSILSTRHSFDYLDLSGPFGKTLPIKTITSYEKIIMIGGGIGIAGLVYIYDELLKKKQAEKITVVLGAKGEDELVLLRYFEGGRENIGVSELKDKETTVSVLGSLIQKYKNFIVLACGSMSMLKEISKLAKEYKFRTLVSVDVKLCCGLGICGGCSIIINNTTKKVCQEGPWFFADKINWNFLL